MNDLERANKENEKLNDQVEKAKKIVKAQQQKSKTIQAMVQLFE